MKKSVILVMLVSISSYAQAQSTVGFWTVVPKFDKMTDENRSIAYTDGLEDSDASIFLKCMKDGLNIYFDPNDFLDTDSNDMYWRFDKNPMFGPFSYDPGTEGDIAFIPMKLIKKFIDNAKVSSQVTLRAMDYNGSSHTHTFKLRGIADAIKRLGCK